MKKKLLLIKKPYDFERKHTKNAIQFTKCVLQNFYFGACNCKNKFREKNFRNEFFRQGNPRRIFIYSIYIFIYSIYVYSLNYIYIYNIYIYIYIFIYIYIYIYTHTHIYLNLKPQKFEMCVD